jgi:hypothetical protein
VLFNVTPAKRFIAVSDSRADFGAALFHALANMVSTVIITAQSKRGIHARITQLGV